MSLIRSDGGVVVLQNSYPKTPPKSFKVFFYSRSITQLRRTRKKIESRYPRARTISTTLGFGSTRPSLANTTGTKTLKSGQTGQQNGSIENLSVGLLFTCIFVYLFLFHLRCHPLWQEYRDVEEKDYARFIHHIWGFDK